MSVEQETVSGLKWIAFAKVSGQVVSWTATLLVMRLLLPQDYGLMAVVTVVISVLSNVAELGIGASVIQSREVTREELAKISGLVTLVSIAVFAGLCAAAPLIAQVYEMPRLTLLIQVAATQFLISGVATLPQALAQRKFRFRRLAAVEVTWVVVASITTLALAWYGAGVWALVIGSLSGALVRTLMLAIDGFVWPSFRLSGVRKFLAVGGAVMFGRMSWQVVYQSDVIIGARRLSVGDVGAYSVAIQLATLPMQRIMGILNQVALPAFARLQDERERLRRRLLEGVRLLTAISLPILWGISSVAEELVGVVLGEKWAPAVYPLQVVSLVVPLRMINAVFATAGLGIGRAALDFRNNVTTAIILPAAFLIGCNWGVHGLASSWLVAIPLVLAVNFPRVARALSVPIREVGLAVWRAFVAGLSMYIVVTACRYAMADVGALVRLTFLIGAGALTYVGALHALDRKIIRDLISLARPGRG
jgi:O-antigen/teichoic acid export membrane protein